MELTDRDIKKKVADSIKSGGLKITNLSGEEESSESICDTCGGKIENCLDAYSYHMINDNDMVSVSEKLFCCKRCWQKYLIREAGKIGDG